MPLRSTAQTDSHFSPELTKSYQLLLELKVDSAHSILGAIQAADDSETPGILYVQNLMDVLRLVISQDQELYAELEPTEKSRLDLLDKMNRDDPYRLFVMAEIKIQWSFVKIIFGERFSSAWSVRQAYRLAKENHEKFPDFQPNNKTMGLLHILIGSVPEKYSWLLYLMGVEGTILEGVEELQRSVNSKGFFHKESAALLAMVEGYLLDRKDPAIQTMISLYQQDTNNLLLRYLVASLQMKNHQADEALSTLQQFGKPGGDYLPFPPFWYLKGEALLQKGDYTLAIENFEIFLAKFQGKNLVKDAYYKIFLAHWLGGSADRATKYFELAKSSGVTYAEADKQADRQLNEGYPNQLLSKIRLLTDGGYYDNAAAMVDQHQSSHFDTDRERVEFVYRQARLLHYTNHLDEAIAKYVETMSLSQDKDWYFAPNSSLQLGYIYQDQGQRELAREYFQKALSYRGHPYKNSIDNKAKSALEGLK